VACHGETCLWERYPAELHVHVKSASRHCVREDVWVSRMAGWIIALMRDYQRQTGKDLSSHDFRKTAFTRAAEADAHPKRAAVAFEVTSETMLKYYTATERKRTADEVLGGLQASLMPKKKSIEEKPRETVLEKGHELDTFCRPLQEERKKARRNFLSRMALSIAPCRTRSTCRKLQMLQ
jgi:hypothetical protein